jgi:hypothetical protein
MTDARQSYVNLVASLTRTTRDRAAATARLLLAQAGLTEVANDASERVSKLAEEIIHAGKANRELMENLIATEVDKAAARLGFARADEVKALRDEIAELRADLTEAQRTAAKAASKAARAAKTSPAKTSATKPASARTRARKTAASSAATTAPGEV